MLLRGNAVNVLTFVNGVMFTFNVCIAGGAYVQLMCNDVQLMHSLGVVDVFRCAPEVQCS